MYSKYWNADIPIEGQAITSNGEDVVIIPHSELAKALLNSETARAYNITAHYTHIPTNEAWHYVFLCSITDNMGRRVEEIGESLGATLETTIARNYPALMAYKRAFDAAAISYLDLDCGGKLYSDQQCSTSSGDSSASKKPAAAPAPTEYASPENDEGDSDEAAAEQPAAEPAKPAKKSAAKKPAGGEKPARRTAAKPTPKKQPSFGAAADDEDDEDDADDSAASPTVNPTPQGGQTFAASGDYEDDFDEYDADDDTISPGDYDASGDYEAADENEDDTALSGNGDMARFNVVVNIGKAKGKNLTIPQVYEDPNTRGTVKWIAETYTAYNSAARELKRLCAEYLAIREGK